MQMWRPPKRRCPGISRETAAAIALSVEDLSASCATLDRSEAAVRGAPLSSARAPTSERMLSQSDSEEFGDSTSSGRGWGFLSTEATSGSSAGVAKKECAEKSRVKDCISP